MEKKVIVNLDEYDELIEFKERIESNYICMAEMYINYPNVIKTYRLFNSQDKIDVEIKNMNETLKKTIDYYKEKENRYRELLNTIKKIGIFSFWRFKKRFFLGEPMRYKTGDEYIKDTLK